MIKKIVSIVVCFSLIGCSNTTETKDKIQVVSTTTMIHDLVSIIGGECIDSIGLMNQGVDPHLYKASAKDVSVMEQADVIVYNGLHLEGQMIDVFESMDTVHLVCLEDGLNDIDLLNSDTSDDLKDPHIWFDVSLWKDAATYVGQSLIEIDSINKDYYEMNLINYLIELDYLQDYIDEQVQLIDMNQRILITAHDAFNYFGNAYGFEVYGLQGISTDSEASTSDVRILADFIVEHQIKSIFVETSISSKSIEALQAAVQARGFEVLIGGTLYSDSLGDGSYIETFRSNIDTIIGGLK